MPLYRKDPEVDDLAVHLMRLLRATKTDAVRRALRNEIARQTGTVDLVAQTVDFVRTLHGRAGSHPQPAHKAFIDSLYEREGG